MNLLNQLAATWAEGVFWGVSTTLVLALIVWAVCRLAGGRLKPAVRCWLWWLVSAKLVLALVGLPLFVPLPLLPAPEPVAVSRVTAPGMGADSVHLPSDTGKTPTTPTENTTITSPVERPTLSAVLLSLWGIGVGIVLIGTLAQARQWQHTLSTARPLDAEPLAMELRLLSIPLGLTAPPRLAESTAVSAPLVTGMRSPVVLLPSGFPSAVSEDEARMALAHELAHIRRGDLPLAVVPYLAKTLGFFLPFLPTLIVREWATAREAACDAMAMRVTGATPGAYSRLLLKIVSQDAPSPSQRSQPDPALLLGATASFHTLQARLAAVRRMGQATPDSVSIAVIAVGLSLLFLMPWRLTKAQMQTAPSVALGLPTAVPFPASPQEDDVADVPAWEIHADNDSAKRYLLIGAQPGTTPPPGGYRLLVVLPGGNGSTEFNGWVRRIQKRALGNHYLVAELIAPQWDSKQGNEVVWPTRTNPWPTMRFSTEEFVASVIKDASARFPINSRYVFALGWASGGPPVYAASLNPNVPLRGSFVAMSIFNSVWLPPLSEAKGKSYFLLHPENAPIVPLSVARQAKKTLEANGATVSLMSYPGGYGWNGPVYVQIRRGIRFLEENNERE